MLRVGSIGVVLALLCAASSRALAAGHAIADLQWMAGCWESRSPQRTIEEQWTAPRAGTMLGIGRTVRGDRTSEYEFVVIRIQDGTLAYEAHPSGQPSAVFLASTVSPERVVFENPAHDYPQQVGYERQGQDALLAWIGGTDKGQPRRVEFAYRRVACPSSAGGSAG